MFSSKLDRLIWRRHRKLMAVIGGIALLGTVMMTLILLHTMKQNPEPNMQIVSGSIHKWQVYRGDYFNAYSWWLVLAFWLGGLEIMHLDLRDHFNEFLFSSGFSRLRVYWAKLRMALGALLGMAAVVIAIQYLLYWLSKPSGATFTLAWPGLITSWAMGLVVSIGMFSLSWFASTIVGQTGSLIVTIAGFTLSLVGSSGIGGNILSGPWFRISRSALPWIGAGVWLVAAVVLFIWGAVLYQHLSLEHNGEYLLFPRLRVPVYVVFVVYVTWLYSYDSDVTTMVGAFIFSALFGYSWLWRPRLGEMWHQWRESKQARE
ncbi:ABC transporter permease [Levilactobacillus lindianensis]|uniref:ABC transporter permease n=1 Tax=Levilactobacillus lindianensis TaxID=2486018 RepID=UPI000F736342|nr:ABC transporter permease [Levilactobacillus lindianensis]